MSVRTSAKEGRLLVLGRSIEENKALGIWDDDGCEAMVEVIHGTMHLRLTQLPRQEHNLAITPLVIDQVAFSQIVRCVQNRMRKRGSM